MRRFNVTGICVPSKHYMADISVKLDAIIQLIKAGHYFTINRARQYGKTTTLSQLSKKIENDYICARLSFEDAGDENFESSQAFCSMFLLKMAQALKFTAVPPDYAKEWLDENVAGFVALSGHIAKMCKDKKVVLIIDEIDKSANFRVLIHFLGMLRAKYLAAQEDRDQTFHSVILAGVVDIKNLKLKMINDGLYEPVGSESGVYNSPWNIAADFNIDMSFNPAEISSMLYEYESERKTGMNINVMSELIYDFTGGYPFLVSRLCMLIHDTVNMDWSYRGVLNAVKILVNEKNVLFDDLSKNLENNGETFEFLYGLLIVGEKKYYAIGDPVVDQAIMYGYIKRENNRIFTGCFGNGNNLSGDNVYNVGSGYAAISNKIFEMWLSNYFISKDSNVSHIENAVSGSLYDEITSGGSIDMALCLRKFAEHYNEIYAGADTPFLERHGRLLFISYLRPFINGGGFYHIESQLTDLRRMDIVVDYGRDQFIIELKRWSGEADNANAYAQLLSYMDAKNAGTGYLLTFDFRKTRSAVIKTEWVSFGDKRIFSVFV